jgi:hypothetical protein
MCYVESDRIFEALFITIPLLSLMSEVPETFTGKEGGLPLGLSKNKRRRWLMA